MAFEAGAVLLLVSHFVHPGCVEIVDVGVVVDGDLFQGIARAEIGGAADDEVEICGANKNHLGMASGGLDVSGFSNGGNDFAVGAVFVAAFEPVADDEHRAADLATGDEVAECLGVVVGDGERGDPEEWAIAGVGEEVREDVPEDEVSPEDAMHGLTWGR